MRHQAMEAIHHTCHGAASDMAVSCVLVAALVLMPLVACSPGRVDLDSPSTGDPCAGELCSGAGTCIATGEPPAPACSCDDGYQAAGLACVPTTTHDAALTWDAPTTYTDDTPLTDITGYRIYWGPASGAYLDSRTIGMPSCVDVTGTMQCTYTLTELPAGTYFFAVTVFNAEGYESAFSNEATATY